MDNEMGMVIGFAVAWLIMYLLIFGFALANYIMTSWGLYSIAERRRISNPWLAWLPIGNYWIIGSIADEYDGRNGLKRKWRMVLLILNLIVIVTIVVFVIVTFVSIFSFAFRFEYIEPTAGEVFGMLGTIYVFAIIMSVVAATTQICGMICYNKIFESTVPEKSVKYLLLSLLVPLASAICLMICRNKGYSNPKPCKVAVAEQLPGAIDTIEEVVEPTEINDISSEDE